MKAVALFAASMLVSSWDWAEGADLSDDAGTPSSPVELSFVPVGIEQTLLVGRFGFPAPDADSFTPSGRRAAFHDSLTGGRISFSHAWQIQGLWDRPFVLALTTKLGSAKSRDSASDTVSGGTSSLLMTGSVDPMGRIDLETRSDPDTHSASGTVRLGEGGPQITSTASSRRGASGGVSQFAISSADNGTAFLALTSDGQNGAAAAYGALVSDNGFVLVGSGDTDASKITTSRRARVSAFEQDAVVATSIPLDGDWRLTAGMGPAYRRTVYEGSRSLSVDIDEGVVDRQIPDLTLRHGDRVETQYAGVTGAVSLSRPISQSWSMRLGGGLEVSRYWSGYEGSSAVFIEGFGHTDLEPQEDSLSGTAYRSQGSLDFTRALSGGSSFSLGVSAQYNGAVPTLENKRSRGGSAKSASSGGRSTYSADGERNFTTELTSHDSWSYGMHVRLTHIF